MPCLLFVFSFGKSQCRAEDLRLLIGVYLTSKSDRYIGAFPFKHLDVSSKILKCILWWSGSQWRVAMMWDILCPPLRVPVSRRAAAFCTNCKRERVALLRPTYRELQYSSLAVTNAWITFSKLVTVRKGFPLEIFLNWKKLDFTTDSTCLSKSKISIQYYTQASYMGLDIWVEGA